MHKLIILKNESSESHYEWSKACNCYSVKVAYRTVDLTISGWLEEIQKEPFDLLLAKPGGLTSSFKQLYDERVFILAYVLGYKIFPSPLEIFLYENKRFLSYWLKANNIIHPITNVFYNRDEAIKFAEQSEYPFVAKTNIGASGSGVQILKTKKDALNYIKVTFSGKGSTQRIGPNLAKGGILKRGFRYLTHPTEINKKFQIYYTEAINLQKGFVIFQEYIPHTYEWRVVRIGNSFFAHKKLKSGEKSSGSLLKRYDDPPLGLLSYVKEITDKFDFHSLAIDIFESTKGYMVNEMQCIFGQSDPYQMLVGGKPGRYCFSNDKWIFEEGDFARNACYNLRLKFIMDEFLTSRTQSHEDAN